MRRLTERDSCGHAYYPKCFESPCEGERSCCTYTARECSFEGKVAERLAEYEDTGLEPEEVVILKNHAELLKRDVKKRDWIPVADREPEHYGLYLVCMDDEFVTTTEHYTQVDGKQYWDLWDDSGEVVAWMPLPEPYRED